MERALKSFSGPHCVSEDGARPPSADLGGSSSYSNEVFALRLGLKNSAVGRFGALKTEVEKVSL